MRIVVVLLLLYCSMKASAQDPSAFDGHKWIAPYHLDSPEGWGIERFLLPAGFAPDIKFKGVEDIRFTPGWAKKGTDDYWSYVFLWYLNGQVALDADAIGTYLRQYYQGLVAVNGGSIPKEKMVTVVAQVHSVSPDGQDMATFEGKVTMTDYMTQLPISLNVRVHLLPCSGKEKTFLLHELSPREYSDKVWKELDRLRLGFKCQR